MQRIFNFRLIPLILMGIILAVCCGVYLDTALILAVLAGALILLLCSVFVRQMKKARGKLIAVLLAFCIMLGVTELNFAAIEDRQIYLKNVEITGRIDIISESDKSGFVNAEGKVEIYLEDLTFAGVEYKGKAQTVILDGSLLEGYKIGDRIKFKGDVSPLKVDANDSYSVADYTDGIYYYIKADWDSTKDDFVFENKGNDATITDKIKLRIKSVLYNNIKSDTAGFLYAMTFGDKSGLDDETIDAFSYTGTAHIFAVSGLHIGMIAGAVLYLLKKFKIKNSLANFLVVGAVLIPFCAMCEFSPSTIRATIMVLVFLASRIFMMRSDALTNLSLAAVILLVVNPMYLFDLGFLMSFLAVLGLITLSKPIARCLKKLRCPSKLISPLSATFSANIALLPVMLVYFGGQSMLFVVANLIVVPVLSIIFPVYLIVAFLVAILPFMGFLLTAMGWIFTLLVEIVKGISKWNFLMINFKLNKVFIAINILIMLVLSKYIMIPKKAKQITSGVLLAAFCIGIIANLNIKTADTTFVYGFEDASECQIIIVDDTKNGTYLIINGQAGYDAPDITQEKIREYHITKIDGVVVVDTCEEEILKEIMYKSNCSELYSFSENDYLNIGYKVNTLLLDTDFMIGFYNRGTLEIIIGETKIKVLADGYVNKDNEYDILVSYDLAGAGEKDKYIVCEEGFVNSLQNYISSTFTIKIKDAKIKAS